MIETVFQTWNVPKVQEGTDTATEMTTLVMMLDGIKFVRYMAESFCNKGVWKYDAITLVLTRARLPARVSSGSATCSPPAPTIITVFRKDSSIA